MKKQFKRATIVIFSTILLAALSAGCGTVSGFGKDVETVGDGIQQSTR
jgi:predicted small secreted protein